MRGDLEMFLRTFVFCVNLVFYSGALLCELRGDVGGDGDAGDDDGDVKGALEQVKIKVVVMCRDGGGWGQRTKRMALRCE